jgi:glycine cleavage system aminomethyltransferase T
MPDPLSPVARTPLHHWHQARGARFTARDGWQAVAAYSDAESEAAAARAGLGLADVSALAKTNLRGEGSTYAGFELVGPRLEELLRRLTHLDVRPAALPTDSAVGTALAGVEALLEQPNGRSLPALRVYVTWDLGEYVWERLLEAGRDLPITPVGLEALELLR